jgi:hypothetical protein
LDCCTADVEASPHEASAAIGVVAHRELNGGVLMVARILGKGFGIADR